MFRTSPDSPNECSLEASPLMRARLGWLAENPDDLQALLSLGNLQALNLLRGTVNRAIHAQAQAIAHGTPPDAAEEIAMEMVAPSPSESQAESESSPAPAALVNRLEMLVQNAPPTFVTEITESSPATT